MLPKGKEQTLSWCQGILLGLMMFSVLWTNAPDISSSDATSFIYFYPTRPLLYPMFIWLFHFFGSYQFYAVMWMQGILIFMTLLYAKNWLEKRLHIASMLTFFMMAFMIAFIFIYNEMITQIISEGLAFPLFIVSFILLADCFFQFNAKKLVLLSIAVNGLILTRVQFYYFYPLLLTLIAYYIYQKNPVKQILFASITISTFILLTLSANHFYQAVKQKETASIAPVAGLQFIVQALYLADSKNPPFFKTEEQKNFFNTMMTQLENEHLTMQSAPSHLAGSLTYAYPHYREIYNEIMGRVSHQLAGTGFIVMGEPMPASMIKQLYEVDRFTFETSKPIYTQYWKRNIEFFVIKMADFFGGLTTFVPFLLIIAAIFWRMIKNKTPLNHTQGFVFLGFIVLFLHTLFVILMEAGVPRYYYYSYFVVFSLGIVLAQYFLSLESFEKNSEL